MLGVNASHGSFTDKHGLFGRPSDDPCMGVRIVRSGVKDLTGAAQERSSHLGNGYFSSVAVDQTAVGPAVINSYLDIKRRNLL